MAERPGRVLVVDDEAAIRRLIVDALEFDGFETRDADDGDGALSVLEVWAPDVIVLDLMMPRLDARGFREEQRKRQLALEVPVIVISAGRDLGNRTVGLDPAAIVPKPFDLGEFLQLVRRIISPVRDEKAD